MSPGEAASHSGTASTGNGAGPRRLIELDRAEALALLSSVPFGRIVFTQRALPAIRPVNHLVDDGRVIIRTRLTARAGQVGDVPKPTVVAYEADHIDPVERIGWSVVITGFIRPVTDEIDAARLQNLLVPWVSPEIDTVLAIDPEIVSGYRLVAE